MKRAREETASAEKEKEEKKEKEEEEEGMFVCEGGLRRVRPYFFDYSLHVKGRMLGMPLAAALAAEFHASQPDYYLHAIADGRVLLNGRPAAPDTPLKGHDVVSHRVHRHEPPVTDEKIAILGATESFVAVYKPASVPMHPTGRYRLNSLIEMLAYEYPEYKKVFPGHRLDRLTSGIVVLGRTSEAARRFSDLIKLDNGGVEKEYLALVHGIFPLDPEDDSKYIRVDAPILVYGRHAGGKCVVDADKGKPSLSEFRRVWADEERNVSLVSCMPRTGRTHQLRVHLKHLGHPIIDDPLYGPDDATAPPDKSDGPILDSSGNTKQYYEGKEGDTKCEVCGETVFEDPVLMRIHLHALRYSVANEFDFSAPYPSWAEKQ